MTLGELLKKYRTEHKLSQRKLADRCKDVSYGYIAMLELGKNPSTGKPIVPSIDKLVSLANGMNMTLGELFNLVDDMPVFVGGDSETWDAAIENIVDQNMKGKEQRIEALDDPDDWIPLAPGFDKMPPAFQHDFKVAVNNVWKLYHDLTNQQRKDEPQ